MAAVDALAAEAERLRQQAAASAPAAGGEQQAAAGGGEQHGRQGRGQGQGQGQAPPREQQRQGSLQPPRQQQRLQGRDEEPPHFEDAAETLRCRSLQRQRSAGSGAGGSRTPSRTPSRSASQQGGGAAPAAAAAQQPEGGGKEEAGEEGVATTAGAPESFVGSRRLLQRKSSRSGSGGLSLALAGTGPPRRQSIGEISSPGSGSSSAVAGSSPTSYSRTARSSYSDFAAAAQHLEGANSMRRATSLGLAK